MVLELGGGVAHARAPKDESWVITRLRDLLPKDYFDDVIRIGFKGQATDDALSHLACLTSVKQLRLSWCREVTDAGLVHIKGLTALKDLDLQKTQVTDAGLAKFDADWKALQEELKKKEGA